MGKHCKLPHWVFGAKAPKGFGQNAIQMQENSMQFNTFPSKLSDLPTKNFENLETDFGFLQKLGVFISKQGDWSQKQSFD